MKQIIKRKGNKHAGCQIILSVVINVQSNYKPIVTEFISSDNPVGTKIMSWGNTRCP